MLIYTGNAEGEKLNNVKRLGMGIMIASSASWRGSLKGYRDVPCAIDNGAFQSWRRGFPFMEDVFLRQLDAAYEQGISLDFIVCPDIVGGGIKSLDFSMSWASGRLLTAPNLALAVQDGMSPGDITSHHLQYFSHIFVGGTVEWKWSMAEEWRGFASTRGKKLHIGQCGTLERLRAAKRIGADSVDSVSFVRNDSWGIVEEFISGGQSAMWDDSAVAVQS